MADQPSNAPATPPTPKAQTEVTGNEPPKSALETILDGSPADLPAEPAPPKDGEPVPKPAEPKAGAPEKYSDFTLPEGVVVEEATMAQAQSLFKEQGLPQDVAQKFISMHADAIKTATEQPYKLFKETQEAWVDELNSDPVIGPKVKSGEVGASLSKMLNTLPVELNQAFRQAMNFTGAGNHPAVTRALYEFSKKFVEPGPIPGGNPAPGGGGKGKPTGAQAMYPNHPTQG